MFIFLGMVEELQNLREEYCRNSCRGYRDTGGKCFFGFYCSSIKEIEANFNNRKINTNN